MSNPISFSLGPVWFASRDDTALEVDADGAGCVREPAAGILYNGHAGLGANLSARDFCSSKNEVSIESLEARLTGVRPGADRVSDVERSVAGSRCLPELEDEVLVTFERADPSRASLAASRFAAASATNAFVLMADNGGQFVHAASEAWRNLLDHAARPDPVAVYQHNQTDLEFACTDHSAGGAAGGVVAKWEGPDLDAAITAPSVAR